MVLLTAVFFLATDLPAWAVNSDVPEVVVRPVEVASPLRARSTERVETISTRQIERKQAQTFSQAIANERGIDAQTACAFCGARRITINGLRGEHTTLMVDDLPLHSTVSGFYGVDAIPLVGLDEIEVYRGAGNALWRPESIGGAINIVTKNPLSSGGELRYTQSDDRQIQGSALGMYRVTPDFGVLMAGARGEITPVDLDRNGIAEQPRQNTRSATSKLEWRPAPGHSTRLRYSVAELETIGGSMNRLRLDSPRSAADSRDFDGGNTRKRYLGDPRKITDNVNLQRQELAVHHHWHVNDSTVVTAAAGGAWQRFRSIYSHGYDYNNSDDLYVGHVFLKSALDAAHLLQVGVDTRQQKMNSESDTLYNELSLPQDDLRQQNLGGYIQDTWSWDERNELVAVLRVDQVKTRWLAMDREIERTVFAPRLAYKHQHNDVWSSRASYGRGYRSPLSLFESQHGTSHNGFVVDIRDIETSHNLSYSLHAQRLDDFFEFGWHGTEIENMAYGRDRILQNEPMSFRNADEKYFVEAWDISYGRRFFDVWTLEARYEHFVYPWEYKQKLPVAAIEDRVTLLSEQKWRKWQVSQRATWIGERNLHSYGYNNHFNSASINETFGADYGLMTTSDPKLQRAPAFWTLDFTADYEFYKGWTAGVAVLNLLDETQTRRGDSPTTFHVHGDHYHLDNFHIWGPLRGRQVFAQLKGVF